MFEPVDSVMEIYCYKCKSLILLHHLPDREREPDGSDIGCAGVDVSLWETLVDVDELLSSCSGGIAFRLVFALSEVIDL